MKKKFNPSTLVELGVRWLPVTTSRLWIVALIVLLLDDIGYWTGNLAFYQTENILSGVGQRDLLFVGVFGAMILSFVIMKRQKQGKETSLWLSLIAWTSILISANLGVVMSSWFADLVPYALREGAIAWIQNWIIVDLIFSWPQYLLNILTLVVFGYILTVHRKSCIQVNDDTQTYQIGGNWKPIYAIAVPVLVLSFFMGYGWGAFVINLDDGTYSLVFTDWLSPVAAILNPIVPFLFLFSVYAWKTGAYVKWNESGFNVGLAKNGLDLFKINWKRVRQVRRVYIGNELDAVIVEHGRLPVYRARFGVHLKRDGANVLTTMEDQASQAGKKFVDVRLNKRALKFGPILVTASLLLICILQWLMYMDARTLSVNIDSLIANFSTSANFLLFGSIVAVTAVMLGLGLGLLFSPTHSEVRLLPLLGVAVAGSLLPDPMTYWLVYISIFAILNAQITPHGPAPLMQIEGLDQAGIGIWLVWAKVIFAMTGYVFAMLLVTKPWYRALPSWPYRFAWIRKREPRKTHVVEAVDSLPEPT